MRQFCPFVKEQLMFKTNLIYELIKGLHLSKPHEESLLQLLNRFNNYLIVNKIEEPNVSDFLNFKASLSINLANRFVSIIKFHDRINNKHWEDPRTREPFTALSLPRLEDVDKFFEKYSSNTLLPIDFLAVRIYQLLLKQGESKSTAGQYLKILNRFRWFCFKKEVFNFFPQYLEQYVDYENDLLSKGKQKQWKVNCVLRAQKLIQYVVKTGELPFDPLKRGSQIKAFDESLEHVREEYKHHLLNVKGFSKAFTDLHDYVLRQIFDNCNIKSSSQLKVLDHALINRVLEYFNSKCTRVSLGTILPILKYILEYLHNEGLLNKKLAQSILKCRYIKSYVPPYLTIESQAKLKEKIIQEASSREKAIMLLALELGLRQSDILNLRLSNIDFENQTLKIVQQKTKKTLELHVFPHILESISNYIKFERPLPYKDGDRIFLSLWPPFKPLLDLQHMSEKWLKKADVQAENKNARGPHLMRYSLVHAMMQSESDKYIITQTLGHSVDASDRPYLSMQEQMLKMCALNLKLIGLGNGFEDGDNV